MNDQRDIADTANLLKKKLVSECSELLAPHKLSSHVQMLTSGRFLRSRIAFVSASELDMRLVNLCLALELLHTSTLVHDDIIDESDLRRGLPTISGTEGKEVAILVGNLLVSRAFAIVSEAGSPNMFTFFANAYEDVNSAQLLELRRRAKVDKSLDTYEEICRGKTVSMLQLALMIGVWPREIELTHPLMQAIHSIGLAFQLADDIEDVEDWLAESDSRRSKHSVADIELGNYTAPTILAARINTHEADARSIDPRQITRQDWKQGIDQARARRNSFIEKAASYCSAAERSPDSLLPYSQRLAPWLARVGDGLRAEALDDTVTIS
jgi:geranylgeranyl diphosphate synthase type I